MVTRYFKQWSQVFSESNTKTFFGSKPPTLTSNQKRLCKELDDALKRVNDTVGDTRDDFEYGDIEILRKFLKDNENDQDLKFVLNLRRGQSKSTVLHDVAANTYDDAEEVAHLLVKAGADPSIRNAKGKIPLQVVMGKGYVDLETWLLTDKHRKLNEELCDILSNIDKMPKCDWSEDYYQKYNHLRFEARPEAIVELKKFLAKYKGDEDLKVVLNLQHTMSGTMRLYNPKYFRIKEVVKLFLKAGADPNILNNDKKSILECVIDAACCTTEDAKNKEKYQEIIKLLIDAKADVNLKNYSGQTLLDRFAMDIRESAAELLLTSIKDEKLKAKLINAQGEDDNTALHHAANYSGGCHMVELLLKNGARWDIKNKKQDTALHLACFKRDDKGIEAFLEIEGLEIDVKDGKGATPLLIAAAHGSVNTIKLFLDKEINVHAKDNDDNSVLHYAVRSEYDDSNEIGARYRDSSEAYYVNTTRDNCSIISSLIYKGASVNAKNKHGHTPLFSAIEAVESFPIDSTGNKYEIIELFLKNGSDINVVDENGFTIFHFAVKQRSFDLLNVLLPKIIEKDENGNHIEKIDVEKTKKLLGVIDKEGNTLLHHAIKWGCGEEILNLLIESGVDINAKNNNGIAPIHIAAKYGKSSQMEFFIKNKANLNLRCGNLSRSVIDDIGKEKELSRDATDTYINVQDGNVDSSSTVDIKDNTEHKKATALSIATYGSHGNNVTALLQEGAKPNIEDSRGWLPLHIAIRRACERNCTEVEREEKYRIIRSLASVSDVEFLMSGIDKKSEIYKNQFFKKIKNSLKDALGIANNDEVQRKVVEAFHDVMLQVTRDEEEIIKILEDAIESKNSGKLSTAPMSEEASAPEIDDNFYKEIGSHVKEPNLYPDLSKELEADDYLAEWGLQSDHAGLEDQREVTTEEIWDEEWEIEESAWRGEGDIPENSGVAESWESAPQKNTNSWKNENEDKLHEQINGTEIKFNKKQKLSEFRESSLRLTFDQQEELSRFMNRVLETKDIAELNQVINEALESGVRLNVYENGDCSFTDLVISQINKLKQDLEVTSNIICALKSKGAIFGQNYHKINDELEKLFKNHRTNLQKADSEFSKRTHEFQRIVGSAIAQGKLKNLEIDNTTFYLECSSDSVVDVSKIIDGAKSLGLTQGNIAFDGNIVKIGESEIEIEIENGIRNYTDLSDGSDVILTFQTSSGALEVRLYSDTENKDIIRIEISDQKKFDQLVNIKEEIGKNCLLGGYSVYDAIKQGYFERSGRFQPSETINLSKEAREKASEIMTSLKGNNCNIGTATNWVNKIYTESRGRTIGREI